MSEDRLRPAPRNSLGGPPPGVPHKGDGRIGDGSLVVARLVWPGCFEVVPATLEWVAGDRVLVQWWSRGKARRSWLHRDDVRRSMRWEG